MAEYLIQGETLDNIANAINAKTGGSSAMTPAQMVEEIGNIPSGTTITNGIVVKARDANGYATEVDKYGNCGLYEFGIASSGFRDYAYGYLETVTLHNCTVLQASAMRNRFLKSVIGLENVVSCGDSCFMDCGLSVISLPSATYAGTTCFRALYQTCKSVFLPVLQRHGEYLFQSATNLEAVQIGSVGHPAPVTNNQPFYACTQQGLTITAYQTGANVDALVANYRRNATNATIIIKASEDTIYNGTSYAAGDTILTSEVTA